MAHKVEEIRIEITIGMLAGKWWGSMEKRPIIVMHGWQDNAGTVRLMSHTHSIKIYRNYLMSFDFSGSFDLLIPLLPPNDSYLAIDFPGHGLSSHLQKGHFYHVSDYVSILEEIRTKFNWERLSVKEIEYKKNRLNNGLLIENASQIH